MLHAARQRVQDGHLQRLRTVTLQQPRQNRRDRAQVLAARCRVLQQSGTGWRGLRQVVAGPVRARRALVLDQPLCVGCIQVRSPDFKVTWADAYATPTYEPC